jgi:uncharacterized protein (DUF302 family)
MTSKQHRMLRVFMAGLALTVGAHAAYAQSTPAPKASAKPATAAEAEASTLYPNPSSKPDQPFYVLPKRKTAPRPNTMMPQISLEARRNFMQAMGAWNPLSIREMMNLMVDKMPAKAGLTFDEVAETLKRRANDKNFKFVSHNPLSKDVTAITGKPTPRVEIFSFCDAMVARKLLDYSLESVAFLPCRISIVEDADKKIWLVTQDWDLLWMDNSPNPDTFDDELRKEALRLRSAMYEMMKAAASGEF